MKSISLLFLVLLTFNSATILPNLMAAKAAYRQTSTSAIQAFLDGLVQGLELDSNSPGACSTDLINANDEIMAVVADAQKIIAGDETYLFQLISDAGKVVDTLEASNSDCQWTTLINEIKGLGTAAGRTQILGNVMKNISAITSYAEQLPQCPTNWAICGYNVAEIFSLIFNWKISVPLTQAGPAVSWFDGLLQGLQTSPNAANVCVSDINGFAPQVQTIITEVKSIISTGNIADVFTLIANAKQLLTSVEGLAAPCNLPQLLSALQALKTPQGVSDFLSNLKANFGAISANVPAVLNCSSNVASCGESVGEIVRLALQWSI